MTAPRGTTPRPGAPARPSTPDTATHSPAMSPASSPLGALLHTVTGAAACPTCQRSSAMQVYETAARWVSCGHTRPLPPLRLSRAVKGQRRCPST